MSISRDLNQYKVKNFNHHSISDFVQSHTPNGSHAIRYGDGYLDLLIEDRSCATTLIMFHAAVLRNFDTLPMFVGRKITENIDANLIFVSDPSLEYGINLGWFGGDLNRPLQSDLPTVISHVLSGFKHHQYLMLFGPSGGGFASLYYSSVFPGSLAIPMNPQTNIKLYRKADVQAYSDASWGGIAVSDAQFCSNVLPAYSNNIKNNVAYIQNLGDISHVEKYLVPLIEQLSRTNRPKVGLKLGQWGKGHRPAPGRVLVRLFRDAIASEGNWSQLFDAQELDVKIEASEILSQSRAYYAQVSAMDS